MIETRVILIALTLAHTLALTVEAKHADALVGETPEEVAHVAPKVTIVMDIDNDGLGVHLGRILIVGERNILFLHIFNVVYVLDNWHLLLFDSINPVNEYRELSILIDFHYV